MNQASDGFDCWALVELFGHQTFAGRVMQDDFCGSDLIRIDIPKEGSYYTRYFGKKAVYSLSPTDEETCRKICERRSWREINLPAIPYIPEAPPARPQDVSDLAPGEPHSDDWGSSQEEPETM